MIDHLWIGGAQSVLIGILRLLDRRLFDVAVVNLAGTEEPHQPILDLVEASPAEVIHLSHRGLADVGAVATLRRILQEREIDVIHAHLTSAEVLAGLAARLTRTPLVATLHSVARGRDAFSRKRRIAANLATTWLASRLLAVSDAVADTHEQALNLTTRRLDVVPNVPVAPLLLPEGFDGARKRVELGVAGPLVTSVSRLTDGRDHESLIRAAPGLLEDVPGTTLLLLGEGEQLEALSALVAELRLDGHVRLTGTRFDAVEILAASDAVCQPTLYEGLPITILDAMSLGVPVVASRVAGVTDLVDDGRTGLLVPPRDPDALRRALARVLTQPAEARRLGTAAQAEIARTHDPRRWIERIERIYSELAANRRRPPWR